MVTADFRRLDIILQEARKSMHRSALLYPIAALGMTAFGFRATRTTARMANRISWWTTAPSTNNLHWRQSIHRTYHQGRMSLALASSVPSVEVSPSDHGTSPLSDFTSSALLDYRLINSLQKPSMNITNPTPIQSHAMPLLFSGYDVMASSATG